jgi:hypothetical protein
MTNNVFQRLLDENGDYQAVLEVLKPAQKAKRTWYRSENANLT